MGLCFSACYPQQTLRSFPSKLEDEILDWRIVLRQVNIRTTDMRRLENPIIIDVEASGFGGMSYPIEVGVALDDDTKYCSLILPAPEWDHWDSDAEKVHRIARDILETYGKPVQEVAAN